MCPQRLLSWNCSGTKVIAALCFGFAWLRSLGIFLVMQVVILCGGKGTRLREETEYRPKPMLPIGEQPILWHIMKIYAHYGHTDFVLSLGYKGEMIKDYILNYRYLNSDLTVHLGQKREVIFHHGSDESAWTVTLAGTGEETMTGARLKRVEKYIQGDLFMMTYGDGVGDVDVRALLEFHRGHGKSATLTGVRPPGRFGELVSKNNLVIEFNEKPQTTTGQINGGFFVFSRKFFDYLTEDPNLILEQSPLRRAAADGQLMCFGHDGFWQPMDTFREFELLNHLWKINQAPWKVW